MKAALLLTANTRSSPAKTRDQPVAGSSSARLKLSRMGVVGKLAGPNEGEALLLGLVDALGLTEREVLDEGLVLELGEILGLTLELGLAEDDGEILGETLAEGL